MFILKAFSSHHIEFGYVCEEPLDKKTGLRIGHREMALRCATRALADGLKTRFESAGGGWTAEIEAEDVSTGLAAPPMFKVAQLTLW